MEDFFQFIDLPEINEKSNFWMIRAKKGFFFDEFISQEFIAIGWNNITKANLITELTNTEKKQLRNQIKEIYQESRPGTALNKCIRFYAELAEGDIAMIVGKGMVAFATIGEYFEVQSDKLTIEKEIKTHKEISHARLGETHFTCPYIKRRKIKVHRIVSESSITDPYLLRAIGINRHSLSDLNEYAEIILNNCFGTYVFNNKLITTFKIERAEDINALDLADFVSSAARLLSNDDRERVKVKTTLHSPGDVILQIANCASEHKFLVLMLYVAIFGGKVGSIELHSLIGYIKSLAVWLSTHKSRKLVVDTAEVDLNIKKEELLAWKIENHQRLSNINPELIGECVPKLHASTEHLKIKPPESNVIDLDKAIKALQSRTPDE